MPTPDEVDAAGAYYGPMDIGGRTATISRWRSETYRGEPISAGRWYHLLASDGITSLGMIQSWDDEFLAYMPYELEDGLARVTSTLNEAIRALLSEQG